MGFMFTAMDESADKEREHVFVVAGYLARQGNWIEIERKWTLRLEQESDSRPMQYFSSSECMHLTGEFARFKDVRKYPKPKGREAANRVRDDLMQIMRDSSAGGFALGLPMKVYRGVRRSARARRVLHSDPYVEMYTMMMIIIAGELEDEYLKGLWRPRETVAYLCDDHDKSANVQRIYDDLKKNNPNCAQWMGSLSYMDNKKSPALQAADLLAAQCKDVLLEEFAKPSVDRRLRDTFKQRVGGNVGVKCYDKKALGQLVDANLLKDGKPSIYSTRQLGFPKEFLRS